MFQVRLISEIITGLEEKSIRVVMYHPDAGDSTYGFGDCLVYELYGLTEI